MHLLYLIVRYFHGMKLSRRYSREFILYSKFLDSKSKCQKLTTVKPRCLGHSCSLRTLYSSDSDNLQETANKAKFLRKQTFLWNRVWIKMLLCKQERKMNIWRVVKAYLVNRTFFSFGISFHLTFINHRTAEEGGGKFYLLSFISFHNTNT